MYVGEASFLKITQPTETFPNPLPLGHVACRREEIKSTRLFDSSESALPLLPAIEGEEQWNIASGSDIFGNQMSRSHAVCDNC
jgi:hypothetical protein